MVFLRTEYGIQEALRSSGIKPSKTGRLYPGLRCPVEKISPYVFVAQSNLCCVSSPASLTGRSYRVCTPWGQLLVCAQSPSFVRTVSHNKDSKGRWEFRTIMRNILQKPAKERADRVQNHHDILCAQPTGPTPDISHNFFVSKPAPVAS